MGVLNVVLIGFMGCGKTSLGKKLSRRLKYSFLDTDKYIEQKEGMEITEIFEKKGEPYFRELERTAVEKLSAEKRIVIATGGGIIKNPQNMEQLKKQGIIVYLKATPEHIYRNIGNDNTRPLLEGGNKKEKIKKLMDERKPLYEKYADVTVNVSNETTGKIIERIGREVKSFEKNLHNTRPKS